MRFSTWLLLSEGVGSERYYVVIQRTDGNYQALAPANTPQELNDKIKQSQSLQPIKTWTLTITPPTEKTASGHYAGGTQITINPEPTNLEEREEITMSIYARLGLNQKNQPSIKDDSMFNGDSSVTTPAPVKVSQGPTGNYIRSAPAYSA